MTKPLRVGVVIDDLVVAAWQAELVNAIAGEPGLECALLVVFPEPAPPEPPLLSWYRAFDRLLARGRIASFESVSMAPPRAGFPVLELASRREAGVALAPEAVEDLRRRGLDLLLSLGSSTRSAEIARAAQCGAWVLRLGDGIRYRGDLPGFWERVDGSPLTGAVLEHMDVEGARRVIDRTTCPVDRNTWLRTRSILVAAAINMVMKRLRNLRDRGWPFFESLPSYRQPARELPASRTPHGMRLFGLFIRTCFRVSSRFMELALRDEFHWSVAVAARSSTLPPGDLIRGGAFRRLAQARDEFFADPFLFEREGRSYLFLERFSYRTRRAVIAVCELASDGTPGPITPALERPYHLSYPCVFQHQEELFMIPETSSQRTIELYRCERFPDRWTLDRTLFEGVDAADATIVEVESRLWMFVCMAARGTSADTELHLFHAEDARGPWRPHPLNPVVSDVRAARPAGRPWWEGGNLIRPAQDCSVRYGYALSLRRVTKLALDDYVEEPIDRVTPDQLKWSPRAEGIHTWNCDSRFCVTDTTRSRFRVARWLPGR